MKVYVSGKWVDEEDVLAFFDEYSELEYLRDWSEEQKLTFINYGLKLDKHK